MASLHALILFHDDSHAKITNNLDERWVWWMHTLPIARPNRKCKFTWRDVLQESVHASVKGGMKYNTGRLLMVLHKPLIPQRGDEGYESGPRYGEPEEMDGQMQMLPMP